MPYLGPFKQFINELEQVENLDEKIKEVSKQYNLKKYKITEISQANSLEIYQTIFEKFYRGHSKGETSTWVENQLRLFIWCVTCFFILNRKKIQQMNSRDWIFFTKIFYSKDFSLFEYQAKTIFDKSSRNAKWWVREDEMLVEIINENKKAKWSEIAKKLFAYSQNKCIRTAKQCRERWLNHLDPNKSKSYWSFMEYVILFEYVKEKGKKWATLVKVLNHRRSQHTIKNKFNAIMRKQQRLTPMLNNSQLLEAIIVRARRLLYHKDVEENDEFIFGASVKNIDIEESPGKKPKNGRKNSLSRQNSSIEQKINLFRRKLTEVKQEEKERIQKNEDDEQIQQKKKKQSEQEKRNIREFLNSLKKDESYVFYDDESNEADLFSINPRASLDQNLNSLIQSSQCEI